MSIQNVTHVGTVVR